MRKPLASLVLVLALAFGLSRPASSRASCAPSQGDELVLVTTRVQGGVVLVERRAAYGSHAVITGNAPPTLTLEREACTRRCSARMTLDPIAPNLYALRVPARTRGGRWRITTAGASGVVEVGGAPSPAPALTSAPASPRIDRQRAGTSYVVPAIELGAPAPAGAVGLLARWQGSSLFMAAGTNRARFLLFPGRCRGPLPGYEQPEPGTELELFFVDAEGRLSPSSRVTVVELSLYR
ncbi:MAG: hypothetical protein OHK0013_16440 [Sandaracinaceae bacterium]